MIELAFDTAIYVFTYATATTPGHSGVNFAVRLLLFVLLVPAIGWTLVAVAGRQNGGRVAGLFFIVLSCGLFIYNAVTRTVPYANDAEEGWSNIFDILVFAFSTVLFFRFGFGKKSRWYFSPAHSGALSTQGNMADKAAAGD